MQLSAEQQQALSQGQPVAIDIDGCECVVMSRQVYEQVVGRSCDYEPWTKEEMDLLAAEAADLLAGDDFDLQDAS